MAGSQADSHGPRRTLLYYDTSVEQHEKPLWMAPPDVHQENSCRTRWLQMKLDEDKTLLGRLETETGRDASHEELKLVHAPQYIALLKQTSSMPPDELNRFRSQYDDIYISNLTWSAALRAAGSAIDLIEKICKNKNTNGMSIMRPPGHHAGPDYAQGFCYFNSAALCAKYALTRLGLQRVMIVDWDVHFGNGTQHLTYDDPQVLFLSIHRFQKGTFWPWLKEADTSYIGAAKGVGKNVNIPLNKTGCDYADYNAIFQQVVLPMAHEFSPQLIVVSCGFDAGENDPEGQMKLTPSCYANLTAQLTAVESAQGRLALILEGGYNVPLVAESSMACLRVLLGDKPPSTAAAQPHETVQTSIDRVKSVLRPYWKCFAEHADGQSSGDTTDEKPVNFSYESYDGRKAECPENERLPENWTEEHQRVIKEIDAELRRKNY